VPTPGEAIRSIQMRSVSGRDFARILERKGWQLVRIHGSHHIYMKDGRRERISLPIHGSSALKPGLLHHFMRIADLTDADL
jgi:predicted RNA binding protein YcfA (HicA-like mRNA interferase family)